MAKVKQNNYIIEMKLQPNPSHLFLLEKRFRIAETVYNRTLKYARKQLKRMNKNKTYKKTLKDYAEAKRTGNKPLMSLNAKLLKEINLSYCLSEYSLHAYVKTQQQMYKKNLDSNTAQKLATTVWRGVSEVLYKKGRKLHFKKFGQLSSIEGKSTGGIMFKNESLCWNGLVVPVKIRDNDLFLNESLEHKHKYCRIVRRTFSSGNKYFLQLVIGGNPPSKRINSTGVFRHPPSPNERVGLDIGTSTLAICSKSEAQLIELAPNSESYDHELEKAYRKLQRSRQASNPDNFNPNGTIKKGIKLTWRRSHNYIKVLNSLKNQHRLKSSYVKLSHNKLSNEILSLGSEIYVEQMNFQGLAKRSKNTTKNKTGKFNGKSRFGKSIGSKSPAMLLAIIDRKLNDIETNLIKVNTTTFKASQYNHSEDTYTKKKLSNRWNQIDGAFIQRDLYSAFLLMNSQPDLKHTDRSLCLKEYPNFKALHDTCISQLSNDKEQKLKSSFGIKKVA